MPKELIPLPMQVAVSMLQALASINAAYKLSLQRPGYGRPPGHDAASDYNVMWCGRNIGRVWRYEYQNHPWDGMGPWHWYWELERHSGRTEGHAPTLESAMADFRRAWDSSRQSAKATARAKP
jgi:hypothetical protein